ITVRGHRPDRTPAAQRAAASNAKSVMASEGPGGSTMRAVVVPGVALLPAYLGRGVSPGSPRVLTLHIEHAPGAVIGPPWVRRTVGPSVSCLSSMSAR